MRTQRAEQVSDPSAAVQITFGGPGVQPEGVAGVIGNGELSQAA